MASEEAQLIRGIAGDGATVAQLQSASGNLKRKLPEPDGLVQRKMAEDCPQSMLQHPAAGIFRDRLLVEVEQENEGLEKDICRLRKHGRNFLDETQIYLGYEGEIVAVPSKRSVVEEGHATYAVATFADCPAFPVYHFFEFVGVCMLGQDFCRHSSPTIKVHPRGKDDDSRVNIEISVAQGAVWVEGYVRGIDDYAADLRSLLGRLRDVSAGVIFTLQSMKMEITDELRGSLLSFYVDTEMCLDQSTIEALSLSQDDERLTIIKAIGCTHSQISLLRRNEHLRETHCHLKKAQETLGTVEIRHSHGSIKLLLRDGMLKRDSMGHSFWAIHSKEEDGHSLVANDLDSVEFYISGIRHISEMWYPSAPIRDNEKGIFIQFANGRYLRGSFDEKDEEVRALSRDVWVAMFRKILGNEDRSHSFPLERSAGEKPFPPATKLKSLEVGFPFDDVSEERFRFLGIEQSEE